MLKDLYEKYYLNQNYNCAECLIRAANECYDFGLDEKAMKLVSGYGRGMMCGKTCGAISTGVAILSLLYVEEKAHESKDIAPVVQSFIRNIDMEIGSTECKDIRVKFFNPEIRCKNTIDKVIEILEKTINDYQNN